MRLLIWLNEFNKKGEWGCSYNTLRLCITIKAGYCYKQVGLFYKQKEILKMLAIWIDDATFMNICDMIKKYRHMIKWGPSCKAMRLLLWTIGCYSYEDEILTQ